MHGTCDTGWLHKHVSVHNKESLYKKNKFNEIEKMCMHISTSLKVIFCDANNGYQ